MPTVLVADGHPPTLAFVTQVLQQAGVRVLSARDPQAAFEIFAAERPDVVLLAIDLPRMGGVHLGRRLREGEGGGRIPLVALDKAHLGRTLGIASVLELRADAYVADPTKPGLREKVLELMQRVAGEKAAASAAEQKAPIATGTMDGGAALMREVVRCHRVGRDALVVVQAKDLERRIFVHGGQPVGFASSNRRESLLRWLVDRRRITQAQADEAVATMARDGASIGASLVAVDALAPEAVTETLRDHVRDRVAATLAGREGRFRIHPGKEPPGGMPPLPVPALACVLAAARDHVPARVQHLALRSKLQEFPRRLPQFADDLPALGLLMPELKFAMQISGRVRLAELLGSGRGELRNRYAVLFSLSVTEGVGFTPEPTESERYGEEKLGKRKKKPLPPELAAEIRDAALPALTGSLFHVLGLSVAADSEEVERAYHDVAAKLHEDRFDEYDVADVADLLHELQERLDAAYRILASEEKRKSYVHHLLARLEPRSRRHALVPEAEVAIKRGEAHLLENDFKRAAASFERALELNGREAAYYAYLAWAHFRGAVVGGPVDRARDARKIVKKGLTVEADDDRLLALLGILEAEAGDVSEGRKVLLKALRKNGRNELAKAALRRLNRVPQG